MECLNGDSDTVTEKAFLLLRFKCHFVNSGAWLGAKKEQFAEYQKFL